MKNNFPFKLICCLCFIQAMAQQRVPNVIVFIADDVSWNDLGCYGHPVVQSPNIDQLASKGLLFTNFYLTASSCSPSRNSILTGRYPHNTGAAELHTEPPQWMRSFPEFLRKHNYYSVQAGKFHMGEYARRGFDHTHEDPEEVGDGGELKWVESLRDRPGDQPFFMWFAAHDAHRNWGPNAFKGTHDPAQAVPPPYLSDDPGTRKDLASYYDEIKRFDHYIGEVVGELKRQGQYENTLIIVMSDNGRPFPHSKTRLNDRGMKSPFIVHWPAKIGEEATCTSLVSAVDIAPTILELAGVDVPEEFQGWSFKRLIEQPSLPFRNYVFAEHNWHDYEAHGRMVRSTHFMYILNSRPSKPLMGPADAVSSPSFRSLDSLREEGQLSAIQADIFMAPRPHEELYSFETDPGQTVNIASHPGFTTELEELRMILKEWMDDTGDDVPADLTQDWYTLEPGYIKTDAFNIRGVMPGAAQKAIHNNNKGRF